MRNELSKSKKIVQLLLVRDLFVEARFLSLDDFGFVIEHTTGKCVVVLFGKL